MCAVDVAVTIDPIGSVDSAAVDHPDPVYSIRVRRCRVKVKKTFHDCHSNEMDRITSFYIERYVHRVNGIDRLRRALDSWRADALTRANTLAVLLECDFPASLVPVAASISVYTVWRSHRVAPLRHRCSIRRHSGWVVVLCWPHCLRSSHRTWLTCWWPYSI